MSQRNQARRPKAQQRSFHRRLRPVRLRLVGEPEHIADVGERNGLAVKSCIYRWTTAVESYRILLAVVMACLPDASCAGIERAIDPPSVLLLASAGIALSASRDARQGGNV